MASAIARPLPPVPPGAVSELVDLVHGVMRSSLVRLHPTLAEEGITMGQFWALHVISSLEQSSVSGVARYLGVSPPTACASLDQLEASGLVRRTRSDRDRRAVTLTLTPRGRKVEGRVWSRVGRLMSTAVERVPPEELSSAVRVFREMQRHLDGGARDARSENA